MQKNTRVVFQAIRGNGYEVQVKRSSAEGGTRVLLMGQINGEEAFYYFDDQTENQVIETIAWQYCSGTQLERIFPEAVEKTARLHAAGFQFT